MEIKEVKEQRVVIDGIFNLIGELPKSREVALAITSAQLAKMWLGKVLQAMEAANPYPESKDPNSQKIEPTADASTPVNFPDNYTMVSKLKYLRVQIDGVVEKLVWEKPYSDGYASWKVDENIILAIRDANKYLTEAGMWLGMELGGLRTAQG